MSPKDKRIELRVDQGSVDLIARAAELVHEPISEFVRRAASQRAGDVLAHQQITVMSTDQFDALVASLDAADAAPALMAAAEEPRKFASQ
jgi:uncharacterized protein (DUF1778 family)